MNFQYEVYKIMLLLYCRGRGKKI